MATIATFFRRSELATEDYIIEREAADPYRLRSLPGDNIYFYSKRVDNSRLVRQADPKMRTNCWSAIATACILAAALGTAVSPRIGGVLSGYQIEKLKVENRQLRDQQRMLQVDEAGLLSPARLDEFANQQKLSHPGPGQETHLQPKDSSLAMNMVNPASATR